MEFEPQSIRSGGFEDAQTAFKPAVRRAEPTATPDELIARRLGRALARDGAITEDALERFFAFGGAATIEDAVISGPISKPGAKRDVRRWDARSVLTERIPLREGSILSAFRRVFSAQLAARAATRRPIARSYRAGPTIWQRAAAIAFFGAPPALAMVSAQAAAALVLWMGAVVLCCNAALWLAAVGAAARRRLAPPKPKTTYFPRVTVLVALYREAEVIGPLLRALEALKYPPDRLDIKLVLEEDDSETLAALQRRDLPRGFEIIIVPHGGPRTKPRALNYASDFARGEIIGVYDFQKLFRVRSVFGVVNA
ncbi:MAG: glycosyltransferase, partial [Pseudomonadota bacterium]